jgi:hypothetical protein
MIRLRKLLKENEEPRKLSSEVKRHFLEIVSTYNKYQEQMDRKSDLTTIAETLGGITEAARTLALQEAGDWFDAQTVKRNMSELDKLGKQFDKCAVEANALDQRMHGLYEDMGHILSRYYKLGEISEDQMKNRLGMQESVNESAPKVKQSISKKEWSKIAKFNKHIGQDGTHYIMKYDDKIGTYLQAVNVIDESVQSNIDCGCESVNESDPCWDGYEMVGMKTKDGKEVPNCVPKK